MCRIVLLKISILMIRQDSVLVHVRTTTTRMISLLNALLTVQHLHNFTTFPKTKESVQHRVLKELMLTNRKGNVLPNVLSPLLLTQKTLTICVLKFVLLLIVLSLIKTLKPV